jgi:hypothetical protein
MQLGGCFEMPFAGRFKCKKVAGLLCKSGAYLMQIHKTIVSETSASLRYIGLIAQQGNHLSAGYSLQDSHLGQ